MSDAGGAVSFCKIVVAFLCATVFEIEAMTPALTVWVGTWCCLHDTWFVVS